MKMKNEKLNKNEISKTLLVHFYPQFCAENINVLLKY